MGCKVRKAKGGFRVGKGKRKYKSRTKAETSRRMALAVTHGFKPTGAAGTGRIKRQARRAVRKRGKR